MGHTAPVSPFWDSVTDNIEGTQDNKITIHFGKIRRDDTPPSNEIEEQVLELLAKFASDLEPLFTTALATFIDTRSPKEKDRESQGAEDHQVRGGQQHQGFRPGPRRLHA